MAGTVAKIVYPNNVLSDGSYTHSGSKHGPILRNMEEDDVLNYLNDKSPEKRTQILDTLRAVVRRNGGRLPYADKKAIFQGLSLVLTDTNWEVRHQCLQLVHELIPQLGDELDECVSIILPKLVPNMGHSKTVIRRDVIQTLHVCMKHTRNMQLLFRAIVMHGIEHRDPRIKKEVIVGLPMLFTPEFSHENFCGITQSLAKRLLDSNTEDNLQQHVLLSLQKIRNLVGDDVFHSDIQGLPTGLRKYYYKLMEKDDQEIDADENSIPVHCDSNSTHAVQTQQQHYQAPPTSQNVYVSPTSEHYEFGVVPSHVMNKLSNQSNFRSRGEGVEELKVIIRDLSDASALHPYLLNFISFLNNLLDDFNFKIITVTLEILGYLVEKLTFDVEPHIKAVVLAITKRMDDNKIVVRQAIMKVVIQLMHLLKPKVVLSVISENLSHKNSRVRQETLNIIIASLLTFPSYEFDLSDLCQMIAHTLVDPKRQVRQASLECFAVLAQAMGAGKTRPLVVAVDSVELHYEGEGVMAAVQARLARRQLPRLNTDRLVDYATPLPTSATSRSSASLGADVEWVLSASSSNGTSARSHRSGDIELESVMSSTRSTPTNFTPDSGLYGPSPRRHPSAGRGRAKLPWDDDTTQQTTHQNGDYKPYSTTKQDGSRGNGHITSGHPPLKTRSTWGAEDLTDQSMDAKRAPRRLTMESGGTRPTLRDKSPEAGSYTKIYRMKYKRANSEDSTADYHRGPETGGTRGSSYSTPLGTPRGKVDDWRGTGFSNSWPDPQMFEEVIQPHKHFLDPISVGVDSSPNYTPDWSDNFEDRRNKSSSGKTPIPTKATLARSASSKRKVPPIPLSEWSHPDDTQSHDSSRDSVLDDPNLEEDDRQMSLSLRQIRNSATKKKAEKLFERLEKEQRNYSASTTRSRSPSPPDSMSDMLSESGMFSHMSSTLRSNPESNHHPDSDILSTPKKKGKKVDSPFESRPRLARKNSLNSSSRISDSPGSSDARLGNVQSDSVSHFDFKPLGGVTFRENKNSDVAIVGKGYAEDAQPAEPKPSMPTGKARERRRFNKTVLSPLGMASMHAPGSIDMDDDKVYGGVVGKGMFDVNSSQPEHTGTPPGGSSGDKGRRMSRSDFDQNNLMKGVYGVGVHPSSPEKAGSVEDGSAEEEEERISITMARTTRERMSQKVRQKQLEEEEKKRLEEQQQLQQQQQQQRLQQQQAEEKRRHEMREKERYKARIQGAAAGDVTTTEALSIAGNSQGVPPMVAVRTHNRPTGKPPTTMKKKMKSPSAAETETGTGGQTGPVSSKSYETVSAEDLKPFKDPNRALIDAMQAMSQDVWDVKCDGMNSIRRLAKHHPQVLIGQLHSIVVAIIQEIKNLRSQVSRQAIGCLTEMYIQLKRTMDPELDQTAKALLAKCVESNAFIREDVDKALNAMVEHTSVQRALPALLAGGTSNRSVPVRKTCIQFVCRIVESMGPGRVLSGVKDTTDKLLPAVAEFLQDSSLVTRYYAQKIFYLLMSHEDFDKMMHKYVPSQSLRNIQDKLDTLKKKGLGDPPSDVSSARSRRSGHGSRSGSSTRGNSASSTSENGPTPSSGTKRRSAMRTDEATMMDIKSMTALMAANDWRDRQKGLVQFQEMTESIPAVVGNHIVKIFDKFIPCVKDSNSKVNLQALQVMSEVTRPLSEYMHNVISLTVSNVSSNLSSKNKDILQAATTVLDCFIECLDGSLLLQPFANQVQSGNHRIKPEMIDRVAYLVTQVYSRKPKAIHLHVLPLLWHLLGGTTGNGAATLATGSMRSATANLVQALYSQMGPALVDAASRTGTPRMHESLQSLIDSP